MSTATYIEDHQAITTLLTQYVESGKQSNSKPMQSVFHELATLYSTDAHQQLSGGPIQVLYDMVDASEPAPEAQSAIARIDIVGTVASARVDTHGIAGHSFTDFFHLLKVEGKWRVVNKVYYCHP